MLADIDVTLGILFFLQAAVLFFAGRSLALDAAFDDVSKYVADRGDIHPRVRLPVRRPSTWSISISATGSTRMRSRRSRWKLCSTSSIRVTWM
jgi:hypothetical protein